MSAEQALEWVRVILVMGFALGLFALGGGGLAIMFTAWRKEVAAVRRIAQLEDEAEVKRIMGWE